MTGNRLFTDEQVNDILLSIDIDELCDSRTLNVGDDVMVKLYFGNVPYTKYLPLACYVEANGSRGLLMPVSNPGDNPDNSILKM